MLKEFKKFIMRGNVIDLAVGIIIGGAFTAIVNSVVSDLLMPVIGLITGKMNFENMFILLGNAPDGVTITTMQQAKDLNVPTLNYGSFISNVIRFLIIALVIFFIVKGINKLRDLGKKTSDDIPAPTTKECPYCKSTVHIDASKCPQCTSDLK